MNPDPDLAEDIAIASAMYLAHVMPELLKLTASEQFDSLVSHFEAAIAAFRDGSMWRIIPEPSFN